MFENLTVLDCTLRDGGYYTNWDFSRDIVDAYLKACGEASVDVVEIGFRNFASNRFMGAYAFSTDDYLRTLPVPESIRLAVMTDVKGLLAQADGPVAAVDKLYGPADSSPVSVVRLAVHIRRATGTGDIVRRLADHGYDVTLNLMQTGNIPVDEAGAVVDELADLPLSVLYFADSFGNMTREQVQEVAARFRNGCDFPIGIHAHNNMGRAVDNTLTAMEAGCTWLDSTVCGMGRGAGNAQSEYLFLELAKRGMDTGDVRGLLRLALDQFGDLQRHYGWGPNVLYYMSGLYGIHPTYAQEMLGGSRYAADELLSTLEVLREGSGSSYSEGNLARAIDGGADVDFPGSWSADGWAKDQDLLVIAPGSSLREHGDGLRLFIQRNQPKVLCLNVNEAVPGDLVDAYVLCHPDRLMGDLRFAVETGKPVIMPRRALPDGAPAIPVDQVLDYGLRTEAGAFQADPDGCVIPRQGTALYGLALAVAAAPRRLLLAGFDGYEVEDRRGMETNEILHRIMAIRPDLPMVSITPTRYPVEQNSLYANTL